MKRKSSLLPMTFINRFEISYGTLKGRGGKNHSCQQNWVNLPQKRLIIILKIKNNNDHGVDVSIIIII